MIVLLWFVTCEFWLAMYERRSDKKHTTNCFDPILESSNEHPYKVLIICGEEVGTWHWQVGICSPELPAACFMHLHTLKHHLHSLLSQQVHN